MKNYWDGYQERPDHPNITVVEAEPKERPVLHLPDGKKLVPAKRPLGFDPKRTK